LGLQVFLFSQLEDWFDAFALRIGSAPSFELAQRDVVLVPKLSYAPVLETSLARRFGVAAGLEFDLPGRFLWSLTSASFTEVQGQAPFQAERLRWTLFRILQDVERLPQPLAQRVKQLGARLAPRFELANRLAGAFEGYVVNRSDWLQAWQSSERVLSGKRSVPGTRQAPGLIHPERFDFQESWQAWLWREILERQGSLVSEHPFVRFEREIDTVVQTTSTLGIARITLMGMPGLTAHQMRLFARLGQHLDIRWLVTNPCTSFWDDLPELARRSPEAFLPESPWLNEQGPALLGLWGKAQRDYLGTLRELETSPELKVNLGEINFPATDRKPSLLLDLQKAIATRTAFPATPEALKNYSQTLGAIQVHACQTISHQLLVLRENLVRRGAGESELKLSDCMVLCADLEMARPAIHQVFGANREGGQYAYRVARGPGQRSALAELILSCLKTTTTQFSLEQLSHWLSQSLYLAITRLEADEAQNFLSALSEVGFVSNLSVKQGFRASFERLLLGAAMDLPLTQNALGREVLGRRAFAKLSLQTLSRCERVLMLIDSIEKLCAKEGGFLDWIAKLDAWLLLWIEPVQNAVDLPTLREDLLEFRAVLARAAQNYPLTEKEVQIDAAVFRQCLSEALEGNHSQGQLAGALNFVQLGAGLVPPTAVIAVLGMNQNSWPRLGSKDELDLTQAWIRNGDLSGYYQDRAALLDALLAARSDFWVFYQGLDPGTGATLGPSSQVAELMTTLQMKPLRHSMPVPKSAGRAMRLGAHASEALVQRYVERKAREHAAGMESHVNESGSQAAMAAKVKLLRLRDLVDALLDPAKALLRAWSVALTQNQVLSEHEPLDDGVLGDAESSSQAWLAMEIASRTITGEMSEPVSADSLANHPLFADGPVAINMAAKTLASASSLIDKFRKSSAARAQRFELCPVRLRIAGYEIQDQLMIGDEQVGGKRHLMLGRGSLTLNLLVRAYLAHCLVNAVIEPCETSIVCLRKSGETLLSPFGNPAEAVQTLREWLEFFEVGLREPRLFDALPWLSEELLPKRLRKAKSGQAQGKQESVVATVDQQTESDELEDSSEDEFSYALTPSAELLWKEARVDPQAIRTRAATLVANILVRMEPKIG
jgi:exonuclease V gamma subunit